MASLTYMFYFCIFEEGLLFCVLIALLVLVELSRLLAGNPLERYVSAAMIGLVFA